MAASLGRVASSIFSTGGEEWNFLNNVHRPANSTLVTVLWRRLRSVSAKGARFSDGINNARSPSKLSDVAQPAGASSPSAAAAREGISLAARTISAKNIAPDWESACKTKTVSGVKSVGNWRRDNSSHDARLALSNREMGVERSGIKARAFKFCGGDKRPHPTRPIRQSWSNHCGV